MKEFCTIYNNGTAAAADMDALSCVSVTNTEYMGLKSISVSLVFGITSFTAEIEGFHIAKEQKEAIIEDILSELEEFRNGKERKLYLKKFVSDSIKRSREKYVNTNSEDK